MREDYLSISAPVFNIQSYSIHDGPGIRVTVFIKGCPLRCLWCANPESHLAEPQLMTVSAKCVACGKCIPVCPKGAIRPGEAEGRPIAVTDRDLCVNCGACVAVCPSEAREISGKRMTVREALDKVLLDKLFLDASGGGMTLSGGECLMHPDFTEALLYAAKQEGIHTAVESCCFASREVIDRVFRHVDLGLLDIKHMDSAAHERYTGVPNTAILENIRHIYHDLKVPVTVRVPTVPGYNDSVENITATARFVSESLGKEVPVHLLPYHRLGESKKANLGREMNLGIAIPDDSHMQELKAVVESFGLPAQVGG